MSHCTRPAPRIESLESRRLLSAGQLDGSFGTGGLATIDQTGPSNDALAAMTLQNDGKVVVAGTRARQPMLERYLPSGRLDRGFGDGGIVTVAGDSNYRQFSKIIEDRAGDVIALTQPFVFNSQSVALLYRFLPDGELDGSFADGGKLALPAGEEINSFTAQSDGKIVIAATVGSQGQFLRLNTDGSSDGSFIGNATMHGPGMNFGSATTIVAQPDDDLLLVGGVYSTVPVARLLPDGALDSSFGLQGLANVKFNLPPTIADRTSTLTLIRDGKILIWATEADPYPSQSPPIGLARLDANGTMDAAFGDQGAEIIDPTALGLVGSFRAVTVGPDDSVVLAGWGQATGPGFNPFEGYAARLTPDGSIDTTFGAGGVFIAQAEGVIGTQLVSAAISPSSQVYLAGTNMLATTLQRQTALWRLDSSGAPDNTFSHDGLATSEGTDSYNALVVAALFQSDGKTIFVNRNTGDGPMSVVRMRANGTLDRSFGHGGIVSITLGSNGYPLITQATLQPDGKLLLIGSAGVITPDSRDLLVIRLTKNGRYDRSFGENGVVRVHVGGSEFAGGVVLQPDGKILVTGLEIQSQRSDFVVRLNANGTLGPSFGASGVAMLPIVGEDPIIEQVYLLNDNSILLWGATTQSDGTEVWLLEKLNNDGTIDGSYGTNGIVFPSLPAGFNVPVLPILTSTGQLLTLLRDGPANDLLRLNLDGTIDPTFGVDGIAVIPTLAPNPRFRAMAMQPDGKIVLAGSTQNAPTNPTNTDMLAVRLNADGSVDSAFGDGGAVSIDFNGLYDSAIAIGFSADGDILLAGQSTGASTRGDDAEARLPDA